MIEEEGLGSGNYLNLNSVKLEQYFIPTREDNVVGEIRGAFVFSSPMDNFFFTFIFFGKF